MEPLKLSEREEYVGNLIVNAALTVHKELGPGLMEKVYEACMEHVLAKAGLAVMRQVDIPFYFQGIRFNEGLRLDLLVDELVIVELKAVDLVNPVWEAQIISHLKLTNKRLGYLINFNVPLIKNGIRRYINV